MLLVPWVGVGADRLGEGNLEWLQTASDVRKPTPVEDGGHFLRRETLDWIERRAHLTEEELVREFPEYRDWKFGRSRASSAQVQALAEFTFEPYSFFIISPLPDEETIVDFRTPNGLGVVRKEIDLAPSLRQRVDRSFLQQDWLRIYRIESGSLKIGWLGCLDWSNTSTDEGARILGELLGFGIGDVGSASEFVSVLVSEAERMGVLVQSGNVVDRRSKRPLDIDTFNCFHLLDEYAPLIFLHSDTNDEAQIFVLVHALAHLLVGETGIDSIRVEDIFDLVGLESWCSLVALEFLLPKEIFLDLYDAETRLYKQIREVSEELLVSPYLVLLRLKQLNLIDSDLYKACSQSYYREFSEDQSASKYFFHKDTHIRSVGEPFWDAVIESYLNDEITNVSASRELDQPHSMLTKIYRSSKN